MLFSTLILIKVSGKPMREFGLFKDKIPKQIITGLMIAAVCLLLMFLTGWRPTLKEDLLYIILSQLLVAFSEELLFRGFILTMLKDVCKSCNMAVVVAALLFGLWHYPIGHSIGQVFSAFIIGAIYGALRTVFDDTDSSIGVPSIAIAHWIWNVLI